MRGNRATGPPGRLLSLEVIWLADAAAALPPVLAEVRAASLSVTATLERLLAVEVATTEARRLASRTHFARLPVAYTLTSRSWER